MLFFSPDNDFGLVLDTVTAPVIDTITALVAARGLVTDLVAFGVAVVAIGLYRLRR